MPRTYASYHRQLDRPVWFVRRWAMPLFVAFSVIAITIADTDLTWGEGRFDLTMSPGLPALGTWVFAIALTVLWKRARRCEKAYLAELDKGTQFIELMDDRLAYGYEGIAESSIALSALWTRADKNDIHVWIGATRLTIPRDKLNEADQRTLLDKTNHI